MGPFFRDKERDRYYLLPGMGGRASQRKNNHFLIWAVAVGLAVAAAFAATIYWLHMRGVS